MQTPLTFFFAFLVVLVLIGLAAWLVRRLAGNRLGANANRGRMPRLAVIDAAAVDGRRRLVLVRRDNVEHLLMIGGPTDIVVEPNIVRAAPARDQMTSRGPAVGESPPRVAPLPDAPTWSEPERLDPPEPALPEPTLRPARPSFADEVRRPAARAPDATSTPAPDPVIRPEPRADSVPSRPMSRPEPSMPRPSRMEPPLPPLRPRPATPTPTPAPAAATPAASDAEKNLAEMAQRLEAALRGPGSSEPRAEPRTEPRTEPRVGTPPVAPEAPRGRAGSDAPSSAPPITPPIKTGIENLEDEMASLLGRPKSPS